MNEATSYVRTDIHGVMRVSDTHVMLDSVIASFDKGHSPETIHSQYPSLTLEQVYGAITYYLSHRAEVEDYLRKQDKEWARWKDASQAQPSDLIDRLRSNERDEAGRRS